MNMKITTIYLVLTSFFLLGLHANEEGYTFENTMRYCEICAQVAPDEKMDFLQENGLTEKAFNNLVNWSQLDWKTEGQHELENSHSTLTLPSKYVLLTGKDVTSLFEMGDQKNENAEAYVCDMDNLDNEIHFENYKCGYVSIDDWNQIDSKELINEISRGTEEANTERRKNNISELHVIGWVKEPTLDTNTLYWAFELADGNDTIVNSVALRLGREGYEKITWVGPRSLYVPNGGHLEVMLAAHSFNPGFRYEDYSVGDKVAEFGIAALVATAAGGKFIAGAGIMFLIKKFFGFALAGLGGLLYKFRGLFKRSKCEARENA